MGIFDKLFRKTRKEEKKQDEDSSLSERYTVDMGPKGDRFYKFRRDKILPEKYQLGMNCMLDVVDERIRQDVYERIRMDPRSYHIVPFEGSGALFTVMSRSFLKYHNEAVDAYNKAHHTSTFPAEETNYLAKRKGESTAKYAERLFLTSMDLKNQVIRLLNQRRFSEVDIMQARSKAIDELVPNLQLHFIEGGKFLGFIHEEHGVKHFRFSAITMGEMGDKSAIQPLINILDHGLIQAQDSLAKAGNEDAAEQLGRDWPTLRTEVVSALKKVTGQDFGDNQIKWQLWWEKNKARFSARDLYEE